MDPVIQAMIDSAGNTGWVHKPSEVGRVLATMPRPLFGAAAPWLQGSGQGKTTLLYKAFKDVNGGSYIDYVAQAIGDCFPAGTMVLGEKTKPIEDVQVGDRVWTAEGILTSVINTRKLATTKPMVEVRPVGSPPISCTADHQFLAYRLSRVRGKRLTPNYYKRAISGAKGVSCAAVIEGFEAREPEWVAAGELRDTDCLLTPVALESIPRPDSPGDMLSTEEGRFVAGYFLGNGYAGGGTVELTLPDDSTYADRLMLALRVAGFNPKFEHYSERKACRIRVNSRSLVGWFRETFYDGDSKSFPGWMVGDESFFEGIRAADGHSGGGSFKLDSTSKSIIHGVVATLIEMGFEPTVGEMSRSEGTYDNAKPLYRVTWIGDKQRQLIWRDEQFVCRPVRSVRRIEGPVTVYDIGVEDRHHSFLANGFGVHNCVSFGTGHGVDLLEAVQISIGKKNEVFKQTATEAVYGMARVDIGGQRGSYSDGAVGAWAAKAVTTLGTVNRDLVGPYDGQRAKTWGARGVPDDIKAKAVEHKVKTASLVASTAELDDALANGYPVTVCSNQGFTLQRDANGFCRPKGHWGHCLLIVGVRADATPGYCIFQSWGPEMPSGPLSLDQPPNSFWITPDVMQSMLDMQDSWSLSSFEGYPGQAIPDAWSYNDMA